jgi:hypothetical protein
MPGAAPSPSVSGLLGTVNKAAWPDRLAGPAGGLQKVARTYKTWEHRALGTPARWLECSRTRLVNSSSTVTSWSTCGALGALRKWAPSCYDLILLAGSTGAKRTLRQLVVLYHRRGGVRHVEIVKHGAVNPAKQSKPLQRPPSH